MTTYTVSVSIPMLDADTPEDAAKVFRDILQKDWRPDTLELHVAVLNEETGQESTVPL